MAVSDHMKQGLHQKSVVRVITVNIKMRYIEAAMKDGAMIHILVKGVPTVFRWPKTGEVWTVWRENGYWILAERVEEKADTEGWIGDLEEGDTQITGNVVITGTASVGNFPIVRKYTTLIGDGVETEFVIQHGLGTMDVTFTIRENDVVPVFISPLTAFIVDNDSINLAFSSPPTTNALSVTVTG